MSLMLAFSAAPAWAVDIVDVLRASQQKRLDAMAPAADGPRAEAVRRSFETLRRHLPHGTAVELRVIRGAVIAETLHGHIVVANESLGELAEGERLFILAHELGHVVAAHWLQMGLVYTRWVPGDVTPEATDPVASALSREASALAHRQEFEADAFALEVLRSVGRTANDALAAFMRMGAMAASATHPGTRQRVAALRAAALAAPSGGGDAE